MNAMRNTAFKQGFILGFSSPYRFVFGHQGHYSLGERDLVKAAWTEVGRSLREAIDIGVSTNGETTGSSAKDK